MSTTFGILRDELDEDKIFDENGEVYSYINEDYCFIEVFFRGGYSYWLHHLASEFFDDKKVYPLTNSAQGIYTIGDCRKHLEEEKINRKEL